MPQGAAAVLRHELIGLAGVFERNVYLVKRYIWWDIAFFVWTIANTLAIVYGIVRAILLFAVVALFFDLDLSNANFVAAVVLLLVGSFSFIGIGMMCAVLPLISPEKGTQLGFMAQGILLVISGVYYDVDVLPGWMQWFSTISPATYALDGLRDAILDGDGLTAMGDELWPLVLIGIVSIPLGLWVFRRGERYAKQHGKLKRSG